MAWAIKTTTGTYTLAQLLCTSATLTFRNGGNDSLQIITSENWVTSATQFTYLDAIELRYSSSMVFFGIVTGIRKSASGNIQSVSYQIGGIYSIWERTSWASNKSYTYPFGEGAVTVSRNIYEIDGFTSVKTALQSAAAFDSVAQAGLIDIPNVIPAKNSLTSSTALDVVNYLMSNVPRSFSWFTYPLTGKASFNVIDATKFSASQYIKIVPDSDVISIDIERRDVNAATGVRATFTGPIEVTTGYRTTPATTPQNAIKQEQTATFGQDVFLSPSSRFNFIHTDHVAEPTKASRYLVETVGTIISNITAQGSYSAGLSRLLFYERIGVATPPNGWNNATYGLPTFEVVQTLYGETPTAFQASRWYFVYSGGPPTGYFDLPHGPDVRFVRLRLKQTVIASNGAETNIDVIFYATPNHYAQQYLNRSNRITVGDITNIAKTIYDSKNVALNSGSVVCRRSWNSAFNGFASLQFTSLLSGSVVSGVQEVSYDLNSDLVNITLGETPTLSPDDVIRTMRASTTT